MDKRTYCILNFQKNIVFLHIIVYFWWKTYNLFSSSHNHNFYKNTLEFSGKFI